MSPQLIPITDASGFAPAGLPWKTVDQARWAFRRRHENGLSGAFKRIGRNISIDVPRFHELVSRNDA
jgi:hypothetical protein